MKIEYHFSSARRLTNQYLELVELFNRSVSHIDQYFKEGKKPIAQLGIAVELKSDKTMGPLTYTATFLGHTFEGRLVSSIQNNDIYGVLALFDPDPLAPGHRAPLATAGLSATGEIDGVELFDEASDDPINFSFDTEDSVYVLLALLKKAILAKTNLSHFSHRN